MEELLAVRVAEVRALALGLRAPDAPEERPAAQPAGDGCVRAAPVDASASATRPPPALLEDAVAVVELGRGLAARERVLHEALEAELLLGGGERLGRELLRDDDDAVLVAAHEVARR